jgi:hypothetical protein
MLQSFPPTPLHRKNSLAFGSQGHGRARYFHGSDSLPKIAICQRFLLDLGSIMLCSPLHNAGGISAILAD